MGWQLKFQPDTKPVMGLSLDLGVVQARLILKKYIQTRECPCTEILPDAESSG